MISERVAPASVSSYSLEQYFRLQQAGDRLGVERMIEEGDLVRLAAGTPLLVISARLNERVSSGSRTISSENFARSVQSGVGRAPEPGLETLEVRVLEGIHKGKALDVPVDAVALLVEFTPRLTPTQQAKAKSDAMKARLKVKADEKARAAEKAAEAGKAGPPK